MKLRYSLMLGALLILAGTSCEDKLDIPQKGVLDFSTYYKTDEQAQAAADALYIQLKGTYYNYTMMKNALSDDVWAGGGGRNDNAELEGCNEYSFGSDQSFIGGVWESYYQLIYKANVILGRVEPDTDLKKKACAEAKFFRAFAYFDLVSMWGDVPLVDHELDKSEYQLARSPKADIWALIERDLTEAINSGLLEEKKSVDDKTTWRVTKQLAQAILGKAYLWQEKFHEAAVVLNEVRASGKYKLYDGNYEDILTYKAEYNCESMLESNRIFDDAEVLLLAAEANLKDGNQSEADACLNEVRQRARLDAKTATLDAIKLEKRLELCSEYTRYQDIIRWKDAEALLKDQGERTPILSNKAGKDEPDNVAVEYIQYNKDKTRYGFKERHYLLPIPAKEIRLNPNMEQNAGW